jgi:HEAT repeat protein
MFRLFKRREDCSALEKFIAILSDEPVRTPQDVFQRCEAAEALAGLGWAAQAAMPALLRTLVVPVDIDCVLALRVAAAEAVWKVGGRHDLALPFLAWALKDEYWGVSRKAACVLGEMGPVAHEAIPDLVRLAERRCVHGQFSFERFEQEGGTTSEARSLLAVVATALGQCGRGVAHWQEAHGMLARLSDSKEQDVRTAAVRALDVLGTIGD